jgi:hypothetical protein
LERASRKRCKIIRTQSFYTRALLVDGLHRIIRALLDGKELIAAQSFKELPAEAFATPKRRQNEAESSAGAFSRCYV